MSTEFDSMPMNGDGGFEETNSTEPQPDKPRADRINRKRLESLEDNGKVLQIFYRPSRNGPMVQCKDLSNIPRDAAGICSDLIDKTVIMRGSSLFYLPETRAYETPIPLAAYKYVFEWIQKCGEEKKEVGIKDDHPLPEPQSDNLTEDAFTPIIDILRAADKLRIPHDSFSKFILKQIFPLARRYLIPLDLVQQIYDETDILSRYPELQEVAWSSIYEAWYMYKLDAEEFDDYMEQLSDMRNQIEQLDFDLHAASDKKDEHLKAARERKRARESENAGGDGGDTTDFPSTAHDGGYDKYGGDSMGAHDWTQENGSGMGNGWQDADLNQGGGGADWADEMNEDYQHKSAFELAPSIPTAIW